MASLIKSRPDIRSTVQQMSARKSVARPRFVAARAEDNSPTPERMAKGDYETVGGGKKARRAKADIVRTLHAAGDISGDDVSAAHRWRREYDLARNGYFEALPAEQRRQVEQEEADRHDGVSWLIFRGRASAHLREAATALGSRSQEILHYILVRELSLAAMATILYPNASRAQGSHRAAGACAVVLQQLTDFYAQRRREKSLVPVTQV